MATGTVSDVGGTYIDRVFSTGGDALSAYIDQWRKDKDVSAQVRIINAQGEQDRISRATSLPYQEKVQGVQVKTVAGEIVLPMWAKWAAGGLVAALMVFVAVKVAKK